MAHLRLELANEANHTKIPADPRAATLRRDRHLQTSCPGDRMSKPEIAQREPYAMELQEGKNYAWCTCGRSSKQPLCDGSHKGTEFSPLVFRATETGTAYLCGCKHTQNGPFCDGTHSGLPIVND